MSKEREYLVLKECRLLYPNVFEKRHFHEGNPRYAIGFSSADVELPYLLKQYDIFGKEKHGVVIYNCTAGFPPIVTAKDGEWPAKYGQLKEAFEIAEIRNMSRDELIRGAEATIIVRVVDYEYQDRKGKMLGLTEIIIDADKLRHKAQHYTHQDM
jgi:hypothetical protein